MTKIRIYPEYRYVKPSGYYVYIHLRSTNKNPFYVGKGTGRRGWAANKTADRTSRWIRTSLKNGVTIEIAQDNLSEDDAFLLEMWLIAKLRHEGCDLCNLTDGGDGTSGAKKTESDRLRNATPVFDSLGVHYPSLQDAARSMISLGYVGASSSNISACARGRKISAYGRNWDYRSIPDHPERTGRESNEMARRRPVVRSDFVVFSGCREAARGMTVTLGKKCTSCNITRAASGHTSYAYGYMWAYVDELPTNDWVVSRQNQPSLFAEYHSSLISATRKS